LIVLDTPTSNVVMNPSDLPTTTMVEVKESSASIDQQIVAESAHMEAEPPEEQIVAEAEAIEQAVAENGATEQFPAVSAAEPNDHVHASSEPMDQQGEDEAEPMDQQSEDLAVSIDHASDEVHIPQTPVIETPIANVMENMSYINDPAFSTGNPSSPIPPTPRYHTIVRELMAYTRNRATPYPKDHVFSDEDLESLRPTDICRWMSKKVYGVADPVSGAILTGKANSLEFYKKAISFYMPNKNDSWNPVEQKGNPTKSQEVNEFMKKVKAEEAPSSVSISAKKPTISGFEPKEKSSIEPEKVLRGMLLRMHAQNTQFINMFNNVINCLETLSDSLEQMKSSLKSNNIAIMNEISNLNGTTSGAWKSMLYRPHSQQHTTTLQQGTLDANGTIADETVMGLEDDPNQHRMTHTTVAGEIIVKHDDDGYCFFVYSNGVSLAVPENFEFPSCFLFDAWRHWMIGFPDHKFQTKEYEILDAPIRPLKDATLKTLPQSLKKKFKDGWKPILQFMCSCVEELIDQTPVGERDVEFLTNTYNTAIGALKIRVPALFENEKWQTWRVATWSRKIREERSKKKIDGDASDTEEVE